MSTTANLMTMEDLLALPEDGKDRELIRGELRERPVTMRHHQHAGVEARIAMIRGNWLERQPRPRGTVVRGEAGFRLRQDPDTFVGIDVANVSAELLVRQPSGLAFLLGPPVLAVEILSPSDRKERTSTSRSRRTSTAVWRLSGWSTRSFRR
jgi:Uma2 family endonuclease